MEKGKVKFFDAKKGFGFITGDDGTDIFVHFSSIQGEGYKTLDENQVVEFEAQDSPKGKQATKVVKI